MTQKEIALVQQVIGLPEAWKPDPKQPEPTRHFLSGQTFHFEVKGRFEVERADDAPDWIRIFTTAGPIMIKNQVLDCDGTAL